LLHAWGNLWTLVISYHRANSASENVTVPSLLLSTYTIIF